MNRREEFRDLPGNILDCLENTEERFRYKTAVEDDKLTLTYHELMVMARRIGSGILRRHGRECRFPFSWRRVR